MIASNPGLIEVKITQRLFDGAVFSFLQSFSEFAREDVLFGFLGLDRSSKFCFDGIGLRTQQPCGIVQINRRRWPRRRNVRKHGTELAVNVELGSAAWAIDFEGACGLFGHHRILRPFP